MSSIASNLVERTLSQSNSQLFAKTFRGIDEEIIAKINTYRLKTSRIKEKLEEIIKESLNLEDHTITIKELNKVIHYQSQENLDKLMNYLNYLSEIKHTIPDFFHTPFLNSVFTRNFSSTIDTQKGLLQKSPDTQEKLKKLIPSRNYLGIYIPNVDFKDIELLLCFIVLEEFLMLSTQNATLRSDNLVIETNSEEMPQHISMFNPSFNTLVVYASEREQHLYLLFLTDVLELMGPESPEFPFMSRVDLHDATKKPKFPKTLAKLDENNSRIEGRKYDNLKTSLPDLTLEQAREFVNILDTDNDYKITIRNVLDLVTKHRIAWEDKVVSDMFEEIFKRRSVITEAQRENPVDAYEVFHAVRYKYKKDSDTQRWVPITRPFREQWLTLFKLVGIELPKYTLPALKPKPILCNFEENSGETKTSKWHKDQENKIIIKNLKPEILKKQYKPEANILIQNTQNITELYMDDREHAKHEDPNKNAFQKLVNAKLKDITQKTEYPTVEFNTKAYYNEALRLSKDPSLYLQEKVNPIFKYVPVKKDFVYHQNPQDQESLRDTRSAFQTDEVELDESVEPNLGSKRVTLYSFRDNQHKTAKSAKSVKQVSGGDLPKMFGSKTRAVTLTSSIRQRAHSPQNSKSNRPIFVTSFKTADNETIRAQVAKLEPILDAYNPPKNHLFRSDAPPENKAPFITKWKEEISDAMKNEKDKDAAAKEALEQQIYERQLYEQRLKETPKIEAPWIRFFKLAPRERGFVDYKYPEFLEKGSYVDGNVKAATFIREETQAEVPFKLFHRSLRRTDKNLSFGDNVPSKV